MDEEHIEIMKSIVKEYSSIINTLMKIDVKKELLTRLIIKLDSLNKDKYKKFRKESINKIQYILNVLDNVN